MQYLTLLSDYGAHRTLYEGLVQRRGKQVLRQALKQAKSISSI